MRAGDTLLDRFIPQPDLRKRFEITIRAPARLVMAAAVDVDMQSPPLAKAVFRLREKLMGASPAARRSGTARPRVSIRSRGIATVSPG